MDDVETAVAVTFSATKIIVYSLLGAAIGLAIAMVITLAGRYLLRNKEVGRNAIKPAGRALRVLGITVGAWIGFGVRVRSRTSDLPDWFHITNHAFLIVVIFCFTWLVASIITGIHHSVRDALEYTNTTQARKTRTQLQILTRVIIAIVWVIGIGAALTTFPAARAAGASLFASAGIVSVIAGLAAQSTLGNVFAGLQIAFSDAVRVDDVVVIDGHWCYIEEITLTYVVAREWDGRRLIVPSSHLTSHLFENWTRKPPKLLGEVFWQVDWRVPIDLMREELERIARSSELWNGELAKLAVIDAQGNQLVIRAIISCVTADNLADFKNYVREEMVKWIQQEASQSFPAHRVVTTRDLEGNNLPGGAGHRPGGHGEPEGRASRLASSQDASGAVRRPRPLHPGGDYTLVGAPAGDGRAAASSDEKKSEVGGSGAVNMDDTVVDPPNPTFADTVSELPDRPAHGPDPERADGSAGAGRGGGRGTKRASILPPEARS